MLAKKINRTFWSVCYLSIAGTASAQYVTGKGNDATMPLHLMKPEYVVPYGEVTPEKVKGVLDKVYNYLNAVTPMSLIDKTNQQPVTDISKAGSNTIFSQGDFRLISYEWGVTYTGMLEAGAATGDKKYTSYTTDRVNYIANVVKHYQSFLQKNKGASTPVRSVIDPHALDDAGSMSAAMIKAMQAGADKKGLRPLVDNYINYVMTKEFRLSDGTLARNRPLPNTLWLDDLYMSLPALAQMGKLTGDGK